MRATCVALLMRLIGEARPHAVVNVRSFLRLVFDYVVDERLVTELPNFADLYVWDVVNRVCEPLANLRFSDSRALCRLLGGDIAVAHRADPDI